MAFLPVTFFPSPKVRVLTINSNPVGIAAGFDKDGERWMAFTRWALVLLR